MPLPTAGHPNGREVGCPRPDEGQEGAWLAEWTCQAIPAMTPTPMTEPCLLMLPEHQPLLTWGTTGGLRTGTRYSEA